MKLTKKSTLLPDRAAMKELDLSRRTIQDYAKVTPLQPGRSSPNIIQNLRRVKR